MPFRRPLPLATVSVLLACACGGRSPDVIYLPTAADVVGRMLVLARVGPGDVVYDLGCGDGRIVIAAVKRYGARGVCVDIDPGRIAESRRNADTAGVSERIRFVRGDLFETDLGDASVVALYLSPRLNLRLRPKLFRELRAGARVVSHNFDMGDWRPDSAARVRWPAGTTSAVHYWVLPADVAGTWELTVAGPPAERRYRIRFEQAHQRVSGAASTGGRSVPLTAARLDGDRIEFTLGEPAGASAGGHGAGLRLRGRVSGAAMAGTAVAAGDRRALRWRAVRP